jgi:hypothetical protein
MKDIIDDDDEDFMWATQRINWTNCSQFHTMMMNCLESGRTGHSRLSCKDAQVLYDGCVLNSLDEYTNKCIDDTLSIDRVEQCFKDPIVKDHHNQLNQRLNRIADNNPLKKTINENLELNVKQYPTFRNNCSIQQDDLNTFATKLNQVLMNECKQQQDDLQQCLSTKSNDCFKQDVKYNFCLSSVLCGKQINDCYRYVLKQKLQHQTNYDFENEQDEKIDAYGFCLFSDASMNDESVQFEKFNTCLTFVHSMINKLSNIPL